MGEVDDVEHAEDEGEADREEKEEHAVGQPVEGLGEDVRDDDHAVRRREPGSSRLPSHSVGAGYAGSVQPAPGSFTSATLSIGTLLRPPATSLTSRT